MNPHEDPEGRMILHGKGAGDFTERDVEQRAREIAVINGRSAREANDQDRTEARAELRRQRLPDTTTDDAQGDGSMSRDPSEPISDFGHQIPDNQADDEASQPERLATEGVEEAQHDQMLAARRKERREDPGR